MAGTSNQPWRRGRPRSMRGLVAVGLASGTGRGRGGHGRGGVGRLTSRRGWRRPRGQRSGDRPDPRRHARPLRAGGGHLPGPALDHPGRHRHRRVGQRAVDPARRARRRQRGRARRGRCSSSRPRSRPTTSRSLPAARHRPAPTTRPMPSTRRPGSCAPTARAGGADPAGAVYAYNHSASYVAQVLALAQSFGGAVPAAPGRRRRRGGAVGPGPDRHALCLGRGEPRCGLRLLGPRPGRVPRGRGDVAEGRPGPVRRHTASWPPGTPLAPGDLVFFGSGPAGVDHVGLFVGIVGGRDVMVDAPYTGADVRADAFPGTPGAPFGSLVFVGATRPA